MAKPMQNIDHHSNCSCCRKQSSFKELGRQPSGFGALKSTPLPKKSIPHTTIKSFERAGIAIERRKTLQHGVGAIQETSPQNTFDKLIGRDSNAINIAAEIDEEVADRNQLQAKESRLKGTSKDKESLLEECCALKNALTDQLYHLQLHKVHHESVHLEQSKIEIAIEELEVENGLEAPRTGGASRLKSKLLGLKCRQQEYFATLTTLQDDLETLKKDPQEAVVERNVFAIETRRLQKMVQHLRKSYHSICAENNEVICLCKNIAKFTKKILDIQTSIKEKRTLIEQMKKDIDKAKANVILAQYNIRNAMKKASELESHSSILQDMLVRDKEEGNHIHQQTSNFGEQTRMVCQTNADIDMAAIMAEANTNAINANVVAANAAITKAAATNVANANVALTKAAAANAALTKAAAANAANANAIAANAAFTKAAAANAANANAIATNAALTEAANANVALTRATAANAKVGVARIAAANKTTIAAPADRASLETKKGRINAFEFERINSDASKKSKEAANNDLPGATQLYFKEIEAASNEFIENTPGLRSESSKAKIHATLGFLDGDHLEYESAQDAFQKNINDAQNRLLVQTEKIEFDSAQSKRNVEEEATRLAAKLEGLEKASSAQSLLQNLTIELDGERLKPNEYLIDVQNSSTNVRITSPSKSPEALAKKKAKEEDMKNKEAEEAAKRAIEDEIRKKGEVEEAIAQAKKVAEGPKKIAMEVDAKKKKDVESSTANVPLAAVAGAASIATTTDAIVAGASGKKDFFDNKMQGVIKKNIKEVLGHLETISETIQQKATTSGTAEETAKDILNKLDKPK